MDAIKFGMVGPPFPLGAIYEAAEAAQQLGLDSFWLGDRIIGTASPPVIEAWTALAAVAARTARLQLGISVTDPFRRNPAVFAQTVAALDHISAGRFIPGIGVGEAINLTRFGVPMDRPVARLEEFLRLARLLWTGEPVSFAGEFFRTFDGVVQPTPVQTPHPPIWIAANAPGSLGIVGRLGDGWLPAAKSVEMYRHDLGAVRAEAARAGRAPESIAAGLFAFTLVSDDPGYVRAFVAGAGRQRLVWWQSSIQRLGVRPGDGSLSITSFDGSPALAHRIATEAERIPQEVASQLLIAGSPEQVAERFRAFADAGVEHFVVVSLDGLADIRRWLETARTLRDRIVPAVRDG